MEAVLCCQSRSEAETFSLVLASINIDHTIEEVHNEWSIFVETENTCKAKEHIALYLKENRPEPPSPSLIPSHRRRTLSAVWMALILIVIHVAIEKSQYQELFIQFYGASAEKINSGEYYRTVTALLLHADYGHLVSNIAGLLLFGTSLISLTGWGAGWFMIITSGILGNLINSFLYGTHHISIGFSTALFGIIGILAASTLIPKIRQSGLSFKAFLPVGGGISLMAMMGVSPHADITAHFFGFTVGGLMGLFYGMHITKPLSRYMQWAASFLVVFIVIFSLLKGYWSQ